ncbi:MAG: hypothetical protein L6Q98_07645 [Anaerolineae bacterium]|nr:hypothetical protein [Anaerolineae bacterium]NUQ02466.1 hypothetical protein [Anaerolineae bacterium]
MSLLEVAPERAGVTQRQRWGHYFVLIYAVLSILIGINLRESSLNAVVQYSNSQAGIRAFYPQGWLLDSEGDYVFRVRDMTAPSFKTTFQVATEPLASTASARNAVDLLTLRRSQLSAYQILSRSQIVLSNEQEALAVEYAYASTDDDPFLSQLPRIVAGVDIIVIQRGQAIIITFLSDVDSFDRNYVAFQRFLDALVF